MSFLRIIERFLNFRLWTFLGDHRAFKPTLTVRQNRTDTTTRGLFEIALFPQTGDNNFQRASKHLHLIGVRLVYLRSFSDRDVRVASVQKSNQDIDEGPNE